MGTKLEERKDGGKESWVKNIGKEWGSTGRELETRRNKGMEWWTGVVRRVGGGKEKKETERQEKTG